MIEILVVIAIVAILAIVTVIAINPAQLMMQSRDANRTASLSTINTAVAFAKANELSLGTPNIAYISIPDPTLTGNQTSTCASLGLPAIASTTYQCVSPANLKNDNGAGWIPIAFSSLPSGFPLGSLPVDPTNTTSSNEYFIYTTNGSGYEVMANPEAAKDASSTSFAQGTNLALVPSFPTEGGSGGTGTITYTTSTYAAGAYPYAIAFDSNNNSIWVTNQDSNNDTVTQIDATTGAMTTHVVGTYPYAIAFDSNPNNSSIWVANYRDSTVTKISDTAPFTTSTYSVGAYPDAIAFDSHTNSIWVGSNNANTVTQIDATTGAMTTSTVGANPEAIAFDSNPNNSSIWVANSGVNYGVGSAITQISDTAPYTSSTYTVGISPVAIAFDSHNNTIWVASYNAGGSSSTVTKISDTAPYASSTYTVGIYPDAIAFDSHTNSIWVGSGIGSSSIVTQINDTTGAMTTYTEGYRNITFDSHNNSIWVVNSTSTVMQFMPSR